VFLNIDGGDYVYGTSGNFTFYSEPTVTDISPLSGPQQGNTTVTVNGTGFDQNGTCGVIVRLGIIEIVPLKITNESVVFITPPSPLPGTAGFSISLNGQQYSKQKAVSDLSKEIVFDYYEPPYVSSWYPVSGPSNGNN
jgi:hypothetical protein